MISSKHLEILHQLMQQQHGTTKQLKKLIATDIEVDSALEEWVVYTHKDIPENWYLKEQATDKTTYYRVDHYWKIFPAKELFRTAKVHETSKMHPLSPDYITWECRCRDPSLITRMF